jgi:hypothetical protein
VTVECCSSASSQINLECSAKNFGCGSFFAYHNLSSAYCSRGALLVIFMHSVFEEMPIDETNTTEDEDAVLVGRMVSINSAGSGANIVDRPYNNSSTVEDSMQLEAANGVHVSSVIMDGSLIIDGDAEENDDESIVLQHDSDDTVAPSLEDNQDERTAATTAVMDPSSRRMGPHDTREPNGTDPAATIVPDSFAMDETVSATSMSSDFVNGNERRRATLIMGGGGEGDTEESPKNLNPVDMTAPSSTPTTVSSIFAGFVVFWMNAVDTTRRFPAHAILIGGIIFCLACRGAMHASFSFSQHSSSSTSSVLPIINTITTTPKEDLHVFVTLERNRNNIAEITDLKTDGYKHYAQSACLVADSFEDATNALEIQLAEIPGNIRERLIKRVLIKGITQSSSLQDSSSEVESSSMLSSNDGEQGVRNKAHNYLAYWSTVVHGKGGLDRGNKEYQYETCVVVAGTEIGVADDLTGYEEEEKMMVSGSRPCGCGILYCSGFCPTYEVVTTKKPVFKSYSLSLKNQEDLHRWLLMHAIEAAEGLVGGGGSSSSRSPHRLSLPTSTSTTMSSASKEADIHDDQVDDSYAQQELA